MDTAAEAVVGVYIGESLKSKFMVGERWKKIKKNNKTQKNYTHCFKRKATTLKKMSTSGGTHVDMVAEASVSLDIVESITSQEMAR